MLLFLYSFLRKETESMTICKDCNTPMQPVMSFSMDKHGRQNEKFNRCPNCHGETKHQKLNNRDFDQMFNSELHK